MQAGSIEVSPSCLGVMAARAVGVCMTSPEDVPTDYYPTDNRVRREEESSFVETHVGLVVPAIFCPQTNSILDWTEDRQPARYVQTKCLHKA